MQDRLPVVLNPLIFLSMIINMNNEIHRGFVKDTI